MRCPTMLIICCSLLHQFIVGQNEGTKPVSLTGKHLKISRSIEYRAPDQCMPYMQNPNEAKTFGLSFRFHHDGGSCDDGLLICYPGTLDTVTAGNWPNMVTIGQFRVGNAQNPGNIASRNCTEKWKKDGMNNGSSSAVWHGLYVYTKPVGNDIYNTIMQMSISPKEYNFGRNDHFTVHFGNRDTIFTYATPDFDDSVADETLRTNFLEKARKGAFLKDFVGLWMLGLDILPFSNLYQIELHIYRSCNCFMDAWFTKPTDSEDPHEHEVSAGSDECHQFTNKTYPIKFKHAPKDDEDLNIQMLALTDAHLEEIVVKLGDSNKNTIMEFQKEPLNNSVLLRNGGYEMQLVIEVHAFNYEIRLNDTRLGNRLFWPPNWWNGLRRDEIKQIELNGQMLLLKAPTVEVVVQNSTWETNVYAKFYQTICSGAAFTFRLKLIGTEQFDISLVHDQPDFHAMIGAIVFKIIVIPSEGRFNFTTYRYGNNDTESAIYIFKRNVYEFKIVINDTKFDFYVNGDLTHEHTQEIMPAWAINFVRVDGNVNRLEEPFMKSEQCEKGRKTNISKTFSSLLNYGDVVKIDGRVKHGAKQFQILLLHEAAEFSGKMGDVPLKLEFDFMHATISCTHWLFGERLHPVWPNGTNASFTELKLYEGQHLKLEILMADDGFYGSIHGTRFNKFCNYYMAYYEKVKSIMPIPPFAIDHIRVEGDLEVDPDHILVEPQTLAINDINGARIGWTKRIPYKQINKTDGLLQVNESIIVVLELDRIVPQRDQIVPQKQEVCVFFYNEALAYHDLIGKTVLKVLLNNEKLIFSRHYPRNWTTKPDSDGKPKLIASDSITFQKANMLKENAKLNFTITVKEISKFELLLNDIGTDDTGKKLVYKQTVEWPLPVWATQYISVNYTAAVSIKSLEVFCVPEKRCTTKNGIMLGEMN
uniref:Galectin domain-containing protein n=1 Tax=Globodera pallida TaxID=36090 RepID=A0A183C4H5_GLOPA